MNLLEKILTPEQINKLKQDRIDNFIKGLDFYEIFNKWGFNDGADLIKEERVLYEKFLRILHSKISKVGELSLNLVHTFTHNPIFIKFYDETDGISYDLYDLDSHTRNAIESIIEPHYLATKEDFKKLI